ncbi:hypothetical protein pb186bvf_005715 [Paramecium bursaria]
MILVFILRTKFPCEINQFADLTLVGLQIQWNLILMQSEHYSRILFFELRNYGLINFIKTNVVLKIRNIYHSIVLVPLLPFEGYEECFDDSLETEINDLSNDNKMKNMIINKKLISTNKVQMIQETYQHMI